MFQHSSQPAVVEKASEFTFAEPDAMALASDEGSHAKLWIQAQPHADNFGASFVQGPAPLQQEAGPPVSRWLVPEPRRWWCKWPLGLAGARGGPPTAPVAGGRHVLPVGAVESGARQSVSI